MLFVGTCWTVGMCLRLNILACMCVYLCVCVHDLHVRECVCDKHPANGSIRAFKFIRGKKARRCTDRHSRLVKNRPRKVWKICSHSWPIHRVTNLRWGMQHITLTLFFDHQPARVIYGHCIYILNMHSESCIHTAMFELSGKLCSNV